MNLFHRFWPELVRTEGFLRNFATPLIKVRRRNEEQAFFTTDGASSALGPLSRRDAAVCQRTNLSLASASPGLHAAPLQSIIGGGRPRRRPAHGRSSMGHASHRLRALARLTARARPPPPARNGRRAVRAAVASQVLQGSRHVDGCGGPSLLYDADAAHVRVPVHGRW